SRSGFSAPLYLITEVREITRSELILAKLAISSSVIPSAKYSCSGSREKLSRGRTARERIFAAAGPANGRSRQPPRLRPARLTKTAPVTRAVARSTRLSLRLLRLGGLERSKRLRTSLALCGRSAGAVRSS